MTKNRANITTNKDNSVTITFPGPIDLKKTFECGQIFRFYSINKENSIYIGPFKDRIIKINEINEKTIKITSNNPENLECLMKEFFRIDDDYITLLETLKKDSVINPFIREGIGLHLLKQDPYECSIAYMLSQLSSIPRITKNLNQIAERWGEKVKWEGFTFYLLPSRERLKKNKVSEEIFREMGFGYRAKYLSELINNYPKCLLKDEKEISQNWKKFNRELLKIYGFGQKVADCVQLFAFGDLNMFPTDRWIHKAVQAFYFPEEIISVKKARNFGMQHFGDWAGYAQEFLFLGIRKMDLSNFKILKKK